MENPKKRASAEQFEVLLLELEKRPSLLNARSSGLGNARGVEQWQELADRLNSMGVSKTAAKWQQAWRDWKSNTKKKAAKILEEKSKVCDGKAPLQALTDLEVRVLNLVGTDLYDIKPPEIDISNIAELDPLSSEERSHSGSESEGATFVCAPDTVTVTVYSLGEASNGVTVKTEQDSSQPLKILSYFQNVQDISNIAELDPLSSEERSHSGSESEGAAFVCAPDTVTVYSLGEASNGVAVKTERDSPPHKKSKHHSRKLKRHRIEFRHGSLGSEHLRKETAGLLHRLTTLEESRQSSEQKSLSVQERIAQALEDNTAALRQQAVAAENQARALQQLTAAIEARYLYNST